MSDTLETLLARLAALTPAAQRRYEAETYEEDYEPDDEQVWLTLECDHNGVWLCGYRVRQDEATVWAIQQAGRTPADAARLMLKMMEDKTQ